MGKPTGYVAEKLEKCTTYDPKSIQYECRIASIRLILQKPVQFLLVKKHNLANTYIHSLLIRHNFGVL